MNVPVRPPEKGKLPTIFPPKEKPNNPWVEQLSKFKKKLVRVRTHDREYDGRILAFDYSSKAIVMQCADGPRILTHYHEMSVIEESK